MRTHAHLSLSRQGGGIKAVGAGGIPHDPLLLYSMPARIYVKALDNDKKNQQQQEKKALPLPNLIGRPNRQHFFFPAR